jgi:hypothetical protein
MLTADDASMLHVLKKSGAEQSAVETFTELADLHVAVKQAEPIPSMHSALTGCVMSYCAA